MNYTEQYNYMILHPTPVEEKEGCKGYRGLPIRLGIDDLKSIYAWQGNSQGDESVTNDTKEGLASGGWMSFVFDGIGKYDQKAIDAESARR